MTTRLKLAPSKPLGMKCNGQEVTKVTGGSQAEELGIKAGWRILSLTQAPAKGQQPKSTRIKTTADVTKCLSDVKKAKSGDFFITCLLDPAAVKSSTKQLEVEPKSLGIKCDGQEITNVVAGSQAEALGVQKGWLIVEIGGTRVDTTASVTKALAAGKKGGKPYKAKFILPATAVSTKEATAEGHKVTTVATANNATAAAPAEPAAANADCDTAEQMPKPAPAEDAATAQKAAEEAEEAARNAKEEAEAAEAERLARMNGEVVLKYEMYGESFTIKDGRLEGEEFSGAKYVDEEYALSFVMPNCRIHLTKEKPQAVAMAEGDAKWEMYVEEEPEGTFQGLEAGHEYYVIVVEDDEQAKKDQERMRKVWASMAAAAPTEISGGTSREKEGCSCLFGNPCVDEYVCEDWDNRFAVAAANGWKGGAGMGGAAHQGSTSSNLAKLPVNRHSNKNRDQATQQLYSMSAEEIGEGGSKYQRLLQERDLAEAGYS